MFNCVIRQLPSYIYQLQCCGNIASLLHICNLYSLRLYFLTMKSILEQSVHINLLYVYVTAVNRLFKRLKMKRVNTPRFYHQPGRENTTSRWRSCSTTWSSSVSSLGMKNKHATKQTKYLILIITIELFRSYRRMMGHFQMSSLLSEYNSDQLITTQFCN